MRQIPFSYLKNSAVDLSILPKVGPYNSLATVSISTLSNLSVSSYTDIAETSRYSPKKYDTITIDDFVTLTGGYQTHIWCNKLIGLGYECFLGKAGEDGATTTGLGYGSGSGGSGGSGGGAGSGTGDAEDAGDGGNYGANGGSTFANNGGVGSGSIYNDNTFAFGTGGSGGFGGDANMLGGSGGLGNVYGQSGGGGGAGDGFFDDGPGGGGGGGLVVVIANEITGTGIFNVAGGSGGSDFDFNSGGAGGGGGGVIYIACRYYTGGWDRAIYGGYGGIGYYDGLEGSAGEAKIFAILPDGSLQLKNFGDSWDYR